MFCAIDHGFDFESFVFGLRRRGRRRNMKRKIFERGDLKFVILRLISKRPMHGYEVMKALEEESKGYYRPSPGSVYPTLQMLEEGVYVTVEEADGKKIYPLRRRAWRISAEMKMWWTTFSNVSSTSPTASSVVICAYFRVRCRSSLSSPSTRLSSGVLSRRSSPR
jgi:DNA-binding PadR family transcriptional regulator